MSDVDQPSPSEGDQRSEIARLEARIEALADSIERCRKISLAAQLVLAAGAVWVALIVFRVAPLAPIHIIGAISAVLGGTVLFGSNASTWKQADASIAEAEARRGQLIDGMVLLTVEASAEEMSQ